MLKLANYVVFMLTLLGCSAPFQPTLVANDEIPTHGVPATNDETLTPGVPATKGEIPTPGTPPTKEAYVQQFCAALAAYYPRHAKRHAAHSNHLDESFVPTVHDPLLPIFENPPTSDRAEIATMRDTFQRSSAKFREALQQLKAGDKQVAEATEKEAVNLLVVDLRKLILDYGITENACTQ